MFSGSICALITPFRGGAVDEKAYGEIIDWHIEQGTDGVVPCGTTGESPTLSHAEHMRVTETCIGAVEGRIPVIAGTGSNSTEEAISLTRHAKESGADAALVVTPYYNKPTQEGLYRHYCAIADAVDIPMVLYNVPPRTACDMQPETVARLASVEQIIGIKEACGDAERVGAIRALVDDDFIVLSGEDAQTLRMMELGAVGTISVSANVVPGLMAAFCDCYLSGDHVGAADLDQRLQPIHEILFVETSPTPTKWALQQMGRIDEGIRLPLLPLSETHHDEVRQRLTAIGAL